MEVYDTKLKKLAECKWNEVNDQEDAEVLTKKILNQMSQKVVEFQELLYLFDKITEHVYWFELADKLRAFGYHWKEISNMLDFSIQKFADEEELDLSESDAYPDVRPIPCKFGGGATDLKGFDLVLVPAKDLLEIEDLGYCKQCHSDIKRGMGGIPYCGCGAVDPEWKKAREILDAEKKAKEEN